MNIRRTLRVGAVAAWLLALTPMLPTFGAAGSGTTLDASGWWNRNQALPVQGDPTGLGLTTVPTVPAPATVPADGLNVANDASGPSAIAAVRYVLDGQAGGTLTLHLASGSSLTGTEAVTACPIQGGFTPAQNGRWDSAPAYDPTSCVVAGAPTEDKSAITFDVPATFASTLGDISILIAPEPGSTTPFSLAFDKPADDSFTVTTQVQSPPEAPTAPAYQPGSAVYTPPAASGFSGSSGSFAGPATPSVPTTVVPVAGEVASPATVPAAVLPTKVADPSSAAKYMAVAMLLAIGAAFWWLAKQPMRQPVLLGSVGGAGTRTGAPVAAATRTSRARGVGRFARPRDVSATPI